MSANCCEAIVCTTCSSKSRDRGDDRVVEESFVRISWSSGIVNCHDFITSSKRIVRITNERPTFPLFDFLLGAFINI